MLSNRRKVGMIAVLALVVLAASTAQAGPISDMIARHRALKQVKLPPMEKPFSNKPFRDLSNPSLKDRFKKRFALKNSGGAASPGIFPIHSDAGLIKTSR